MKPDKKVMSFLAAALFAAAFNRLVNWWKDADLRQVWQVVALFALAMLLGGAAFLYAFGFIAL